MKNRLVMQCHILLLLFVLVAGKVTFAQVPKKHKPGVAYDSTFLVEQVYDSSFNGDWCIADTICVFNCNYLLRRFSWPVIEAQIKRNDEDATLNFVYFTTANNKEYLRIVQMPSYPLGDYYEVGYRSALHQKEYLRLPIKKLTTNTNVTLGMSENSLLAKKGRKYSQVNYANGVRRYVYMWKYEDSPHGSFYLCFYEFRKAKLIRYGFGVSDRVWN